MKINYFEAEKKSVDGLITRALSSMAKGGTHVQVAAVGVLVHACKHGDWTKAAVLVEGVHANGGNAKALIQWFVAFGGSTADGQGFTAWEKKAVRLDDAKATMWWSFKPKAAFSGFDLKASVIKLVKSAEAAQKRASKNAEEAKLVEVDPALLEALRKLA